MKLIVLVAARRATMLFTSPSEPGIETPGQRSNPLHIDNILFPSERAPK